MNSILQTHTNMNTDYELFHKEDFKSEFFENLAKINSYTKNEADLWVPYLVLPFINGICNCHLDRIYGYREAIKEIINKNWHQDQTIWGLIVRLGSIDNSIMEFIADFLTDNERDTYKKHVQEKMD